MLQCFLYFPVGFSLADFTAIELRNYAIYRVSQLPLMSTIEKFIDPFRADPAVGFGHMFFRLRPGFISIRASAHYGCSGSKASGSRYHSIATDGRAFIFLAHAPLALQYYSVA